MKCSVKTITLCALAAWLLATVPQACLATTYYVSTTGSDGNSGSSSSPFATLAHAVSVVHAGDTVDMDSGTYSISSPVVVTTSGTSSSRITIQTTPSNSTAVLNGNGVSGGLGDVIDVEASYITINNLTIQGGGGGNFECVDLYTGNDDTLENCTCEYGEWGGADISRYDSSTQVTGDSILDCTFYDNSTVNTGDPGTTNWGGGVGMNNCTDSTISGCKVYDNWGEGLTGAGSNTASGGNLISNNIVYDNFSVELYLNCIEGTTVANNLIYVDTTTYNRSGQGAAFGIAVDNESNAYLTDDCDLYNNIVIGGAECFRYANTNTYSGFYNGGLNGYNIYNNVFYGGDAGTIQIDNDSGNNFAWRNNISWQITNGTTIAYDGGGGSQTLSNNCWDGTGADNMNVSGDVILSNSNPGFASPGSDTASSYVLSSTSPCYSSGYNAYSLFTYDYNGATRPSSGAWTMGAYAAAGGGGSGAYVQQNSNDPVSANTISVNYPSAQTSGNLDVVVVGCNSTTATVSSVSDSAGNSYSLAVGPTTGGGQRQWIYYAPNIHSGSNTVTVTMSTTVNYPDIRVLEYTGYNAVDVKSGANGNSATASSGSATTTSANDLIFTADTAYPDTTGVGSGFTTRVTTIDGDIAADKTVTSTGSYSGSATLAASNYWVMQMVAFKRSAPPAFVQVNSNDPVSASSITVAYPSAQTSGDLDIVVVGCNSTTATVSSVTDSAGNTYTLAIGPNTGGGQRQWIYYAPHIHSGSNTVTVNMNSTVDYPDIRVLEYSGVSTLDQISGASGTSSTANSGSATTTSANELIFTADTAYPDTTGVGSGFTTRVTTIDGDIAADRVVSSTGSYFGSATLAGSNYWVMQMATFK